jgi:hypothetical protein
LQPFDGSYADLYDGFILKKYYLRIRSTKSNIASSFASTRQRRDGGFVWLITHQPAQLFSRTNQQPANSIFLLQQISTSHQPPTKRTDCLPACCRCHCVCYRIP